MDRDGVAVVPEAAADIAVGKRPSGLHALRNPGFRWYFLGQIASASGTFVQQTAIAWLVLQLTGSAAALGVVLAVGGLPSLILGPWGGVVADRFDLRRLLLVTQTIQGGLAGVLTVMGATGYVSVVAVVALNVVGGVVQIVDSPARQAFVPQLVPPDDLASAASVNGVVMNSARVVGPAVAGVLIATVGTTACFAVNTVSYLAVIAALAMIRPLSTATRAGSSDGLGEGLRYVRAHQQLWLPLAMMALVGLVSFNFPVILPVFAQSTFHGTGTTYSLLSVMLSVGSVVGSLAVGQIPHPRRIYLVGASLAFGVALAATAAAPNLVFACILLAVSGATGFCFVTLASVALQLHAEPQYRGRVMALWVFVFIGTTPIGSIVMGWVTGSGGPRVALLIAAGAAVVAAGAAAFVRTPPHPDEYLRQPPVADR
ncbi:MFS transporter [Gordonia sp. TBRC 11910]|uniref:MFS transporter n=1 Tax=Gordonia asplenii TaxID=2725283 RepID=A0A848KXI7_9ACTN|nr:MFS transporter [Gordonia asplenii]NMO03049.1 MFS transporter [Gordonia asplenii]